MANEAGSIAVFLTVRGVNDALQKGRYVYGNAYGETVRIYRYKWPRGAKAPMGRSLATGKWLVLRDVMIEGETDWHLKAGA